MKLRLQSAKKLLPILSRAIEEEDIENMGFGCMLEILMKHFTLPVSRMPPHIKKMLVSFWTQYSFLFDGEESDSEQERQVEQGSEDEQEQESDDEEESDDEQGSEDEWEIKEEREDEGEMKEDEWENKEEQKSDDEWEMKEERENERENKEEEEKGDDEQEEESDGEWETEEEQEKADKEESEDEERKHMLCEAESIIKQELRAPSYLNKYMKQRIHARQRIRQLFMLGINLTSNINKQLLLLKLKKEPKNSQNNNTTASLRGPETLGDSLQHTLESSSSFNMVGCDDEFNTIMDNLNQQSSEREIVSIVGMGGIGKTTLARRIYGDDSLISRFDCRAWVTISQEYNPTKVFNALLRSLAPGENNEASCNNELAELVYECLKRQRYFIIIDDIWSTDVWSDLQKCFPDDNCRSRILLTTRLKNVADYAAASSGTNSCHTMRFLDSYESWNLFYNKVLTQRITTLSPEFERIGRDIVNKCKGLPLAISVVAGLLSNSKQDLDEWELIAQNVHTLSLDHSNQQCENIIDLSYTFLPHHLKHCFLSLGLFPEDNEIPEDIIIEFWVSEGFLKILRFKSLEDVARESLQDLVDRNLLIFREMNGGLSKVYQMHDVLRELALREAQKESLLCYHNDNGNDFEFSLGFRRIIQPWSISKICSYNSVSQTCNKTFLALDSSIRHRYPEFLRGLLMIGEPEDVNVTEFMGLLHLRCLLSDCILKPYCLPLFMLWNLQRLRVELDHSIDKPINIWGLPQLKNLDFPKGITLDHPRSVHHNLESIKYLDYRSCTKELFMRIPNLRTLGVVKGDTINLKCKASNWLESLAYLYKLENLEVCGKLLHPKFSTGSLSIEIFLPNLKKLKLSDTKLNWKNMFVLGMLSKLEVLIIRKNGGVGRKWKLKNRGFHRLKFLGIFYCDLQYWKVTSGHFPVLECLILGRMPLLKKIPSDFADIVTLKSIKLYDCLNSAISSAKRIEEEQREYGNNMFVVDILRHDDIDDELFFT